MKLQQWSIFHAIHEEKKFHHFFLLSLVSGYSCCGTVRVIPRHLCSPCATIRRSSTSRSSRSVPWYYAVTLYNMVKLHYLIYLHKAQWGRSLLYKNYNCADKFNFAERQNYLLLNLILKLNYQIQLSPTKRHIWPCRATFSKSSEVQPNHIVKPLRSIWPATLTKLHNQPFSKACHALLGDFEICFPSSCQPSVFIYVVILREST